MQIQPVCPSSKFANPIICMLGAFQVNILFLMSFIPLLPPLPFFRKMSMGGATAPMTAAPGAAQSVTAPPIMTAPSAVPMFTPGVVAGTPPAAMQPPPMFTPGPPAPAAPPVSAPAPGGMIAPPPLAAPGSGAVGIGMAPASATQLQQPPPGIASVARAADPVSASVASGGYGSQVIELPTTSSGVVLPSPPAVYHWFFQHQSNQWSVTSAFSQPNSPRHY